VLFLPRSNFPERLRVIVKKVKQGEFEITTDPQLDPMIFASFVSSFKQCGVGVMVKIIGGKLIVLGDNPDFDAIIRCVGQFLPMPVEYELV
jgi:hypothetical protein